MAAAVPSLATSSSTPTARPPAGSPSYWSCKQLWQLVTEQSLVASDDVLSRELDRHRDLLAKGVAWFGRRNKKASSSTSSLGTASTAPTVRQKAPGKLSRFLSKLSEFCGLEDDAKARGILTAYLAGDFRGTKQSLRRLVDDERLQRPLMADVWQFYRAERLHLLQVLKELLTHASNSSHRHRGQLAAILSQLEGTDGGALARSLLTQLEWVLTEAAPSRETHGAAWSDDLQGSWALFNLREQAELLQINLLYLHHTGGRPGRGLENFKEYFQLFQEHSFGHSQASSSGRPLSDTVGGDLVESVGMLQSLLLVYLVDLPSASVRSADHAMLDPDQQEAAAKMERAVVGLGSCAEHGPIMLAWMLARYMLSEDDPAVLARYQTLGERAVHLRAVNFLTRACANGVIASHSALHGVVRGICYALLAVMSTSFDLKQMGMMTDALALTQDVLQSAPISADFWRQGLDVGLGPLFASQLSCFPLELRPFASFCTKLCEGGAESSERVLGCLEAMPVFAEYVGEVNPATVVKSDDGERWQLRVSRPFRPGAAEGEAARQFAVPVGTIGVVQGQLVRWNCRFSAFRYFLGEIELLAKQLSFGAQNVQQATLMNVNEILTLLESLLRNSATHVAELEDTMERPLFALMERASRLAQPPLKLLANCLKVLCVVAKRKPDEIWRQLADTGIFPHFASRTKLGSKGDESDISPGVVGALLAQQECVDGEYPLSTAFFDVMLTCFRNQADCDDLQSVAASIRYIANDLLPCYRQWRFESPVSREEFGQKMLSLFKTFLRDQTSRTTRDLLCAALVQPAPLQAILHLVGIGDRAIRSFLETQSSWESGVGVELSRLVNLAMNVFERLLVLAAQDQSLAPRLEDISHQLCSLPTGGVASSHFLLTLAHYIYHSQSCELPVSAMKLLGTSARMFPMSLLACLGNDAEAVRDILIFRLESQTEDVTLKVAIVDLFSACVDSQPGFIQLLIGVKQDVQVVGAKEPLSTEDKAKNASVELVSEQGCLRLVLELLDTVTKQNGNKKLEELHLSLVNLVLNLWQHQRILAMTYLKKNSDFWTRITWSLFDKQGVKRTAVNSRIFRVLSNEVYTYKGQVDKELQKVLEKLCDEKEEHLINWNRKVLESVEPRGKLMEEESQRCEVTVALLDDRMSLLNAWKALISILSKDQPVSFSPLHCHQIVSGLIDTLEEHFLAPADGCDPRAATAVSELCLVLMRRWHSKSAGADMSAWVGRVGRRFLGALASPACCSWERLPARCRAAAVGIAATALKTSSHFKLENEAEALTAWIDPVAVIVQRAFRQDYGVIKDEDRVQEDQFAIISVDLLRMLIQRIKEPSEWYRPIHHHVLVQTLLAKLSQNFTSQTQPELCQSILGLLALIAKHKQGLDALLTSSISQFVWLPLSDVGKKGGFPGGSGREWARVFRLSLDLAKLLQVQGKHLALQGTLDVLVLLQERLTAFATLPNAVLHGADEARLMVESISLAAEAMKYYKQWHLLHSTSLAHYYNVLCSNLFHCTCLLIRPATLSQMITKTDSAAAASDRRDQQRMRRLSSTDQELEAAASSSGAAPEVASAQAALLEAAAAILAALLELSPKLQDLVAGDEHDPAEFQQLLGVGFSAPSFEQETVLTYGTLTSLCNFCIRSLSKMGSSSSSGFPPVSDPGNRTPSPITPSKSPGPPTLGLGAGGGLLSSSPAQGQPSSVNRLALPTPTSAASVAGSTTTVSGSPERRRLMVVLERAMTLMLAQALLYFSDPSVSIREKPFLRRELGAEFQSFSESIRRYITGHHHRGDHHRRSSNSMSPGGGASGAHSPGVASVASSSIATTRSAEEQQFLKTINALVQHVFK